MGEPDRPGTRLSATTALAGDARVRVILAISTRGLVGPPSRSPGTTVCGQITQQAPLSLLIARPSHSCVWGVGDVYNLVSACLALCGFELDENPRAFKLSGSL